RSPTTTTRSPYTTLFRSTRHPVAVDQHRFHVAVCANAAKLPHQRPEPLRLADREVVQRRVAANVLVAGALAHETHEPVEIGAFRSEEHTSELQSRENLVC